MSDMFGPLSSQSSFKDSLVNMEWDRVSAPTIMSHLTHQEPSTREWRCPEEPLCGLFDNPLG